MGYLFFRDRVGDSISSENGCIYKCVDNCRYKSDTIVKSCNFADNGSGSNVYDEGLPKDLYKLGVRYWDQKGQGSIYPSTRRPAGNVLAYQEYWFRIQSKNGIVTGAAKQEAKGNRVGSHRDDKWDDKGGVCSSHAEPGFQRPPPESE